MNFNLAEEIRKMLELMDKSPRVNRFVWFVTIFGGSIFLIWLLLNGFPSVIEALIKWQQMTGKP
ncbi:hypothetical protein [Rodentibacter myodis]|uniref:Uncharacterized protein n=1 Tax=Rodentibacter myodis TaxID=1907939 RepID=A0A1V3JHX5_9PAST|nr:hypothetical protein [Rodentibacter myodis]OOF56029.1 hypothetical protein BKL49_10830 [Rodentibacter myodis]